MAIAGAFIAWAKRVARRIVKDNRLFINAVFWVFRTGAPWRDLPAAYGGWSNTHRRFLRWRNKEVWANVLAALVVDVDYKWLMIDASHIKVHPHAAGAIGGNQAMGVTKGGSIQKYTSRLMHVGCRFEPGSRRGQSQIAPKLLS